MDTKHIIVLTLMLATLTMLILGVGLMMRGGELNKKYSNKLMVARVVFQGLTLLALGLLFAVGK